LIAALRVSKTVFHRHASGCFWRAANIPLPAMCFRVPSEGEIPTKTLPKSGVI
jgi:hypothetical protein